MVAPPDIDGLPPAELRQLLLKLLEENAELKRQNAERPCEKFILEQYGEASSELQRYPAAFLMSGHGIRNLSKGGD